MLKNISSLSIPFMLCMLYACQTLPQLFTAAEEIADDNAIKIEVQKEALQKDSNVDVSLKITNKNEPTTK